MVFRGVTFVNISHSTGGTSPRSNGIGIGSYGSLVVQLNNWAGTGCPSSCTLTQTGGTSSTQDYSAGATANWWLQEFSSHSPLNGDTWQYSFTSGYGLESLLGVELMGKGSIMSYEAANFGEYSPTQLLHLNMSLVPGASFLWQGTGGNLNTSAFNGCSWTPLGNSQTTDSTWAYQIFGNGDYCGATFHNTPVGLTP